MKRLVYAFVLVFFVCSSQEASAQSIGTPIQTGFAVITPADGVGAGLSVSEVFGQDVSGILFRSSVLPSPLVTSTSIFIRVDPNAAMDTGVTIVNPNVAPTTVILTLNNDQGITIATRTITNGVRQQVSRFVTELFPQTPELLGPFTGLLFITADFPVGVLGLAFTGPSFTALPVATQLLPNATSPAGVITTGTGNTFVLSGGGPIQTFNANAPANTFAIPPVEPIPPVPPTINPPLPNTLTPMPSTITQIPSTFSSLPPVVPTTVNPAAFVPATTVTTTTATGVLVVRGDVVFVFPEITTGVGGIAAQLLPQVATGGGWFSTIAIANTSSANQVVRADFFNSLGGPLLLPFGSRLTGIVVPAGGVVTLSTN
jgi:hypothetical protein